MNITIVGAGLSGAVAAALLREKGHKITVFETRPHIAGNCYDSDIKGIRVHNYGPHAFHTNDEKIWQFVQKYDQFNNFRLKVVARLEDDRIINIPYNKLTAQQVGDWDDRKILKEIFIPYSEKQWGKNWEEIPFSFTSRLALRRDDASPYYHLDTYQGLPKSGYSTWISNMFEGCEVNLDCDIDRWRLSNYDLLIFTGSIDSYYKYYYGKLNYRSLRFNFIEEEKTEFVQINECNNSYGYTRTIDHSHWNPKNTIKTILSREYSERFNLNDVTTDRFYPERYKCTEMHNKYLQLKTDTIFLGRLGTYQYLDMDDCIQQVMERVSKI